MRRAAAAVVERRAIAAAEERQEEQLQVHLDCAIRFQIVCMVVHILNKLVTHCIAREFLEP